MRFRNKPIVIEAEQFLPESLPLPFLDRGPYVTYFEGAWYVTTAHAQTVKLSPGDWVVLEPVGPHVPSFAAYPVKPDIFAARYEPVVIGAPEVRGGLLGPAAHGLEFKGEEPVEDSIPGPKDLPMADPEE